jgi:hypothetical protein
MLPFAGKAPAYRYETIGIIYTSPSVLDWCQPLNQISIVTYQYVSSLSSSPPVLQLPLRVVLTDLQSLLDCEKNFFLSLSLSLSLGGVTLKRRCTYRPSVIYLIVNKLLSLPPFFS